MSALAKSNMRVKEERGKESVGRTDELNSETVLDVRPSVNGSLLLLGKFCEDLILGHDGVLLSHGRKVSIVRLGFLKVQSEEVTSVRGGDRRGGNKSVKVNRGRTSEFSRWTFSSRVRRLKTLRLFCSSNVLQAVES